MRLFLILALGALASCQGVETKPSPLISADAKWVELKGGCFEMGEESVYREETPIKQTCIQPFEIWSHEITTAEFAKFVEETGYKTRAEKGWASNEEGGPGVDMSPGSAVFTPPASVRSPSWWKLTDGAAWRHPLGPSKPKADPSTPVVHLTRQDAAAYAAWVGGRLPSEAEWEFAARGGLDGELMGWAEAESLALEDQANTWQGVFPVLNSAEDGHAGVAPVGSYPANGFGLHDMIGNVWEWTGSTYYPTHEPGTAVEDHPYGYDPAQGDIPVGVIKGGSFLCARSYCYRYRPAARQPQDLIFGTSHIGFRVARDVAG